MEADARRRIAMAYLEPLYGGPPARQPSVAEGDIVFLGPSGALAFEVLAVRGDKAWIRDLDDGRHGVVDVANFREFGPGSLGLVQ
jgi:hypothetical protein